MLRLPPQDEDARLERSPDHGRLTQDDDRREAARLAVASRSPATWEAYERDLVDFRRFCDELQHEALPATPDTICDYLAHRSREGVAAGTLSRRLSAIAQLHRAKGLQNPCASYAVKSVMRGIRRERGDELVDRRKAAITREELVRIVAQIPSYIPGPNGTVSRLRDRALILLGWATAMRKSELVALDVRDASFEEAGFVITIR